MSDPPLNLYDAVFTSKRAKQHGSSPAVICLGEGHGQIKYEQLQTFVDTTRAKADINAGQNVVLVMPNSLELIVGLLSVWAQGAAAVPLNPAYTSAELKPLLEDLGVKKVLILPGADKVKAILNEASADLDIIEVRLDGSTTSSPASAQLSELQVDQSNGTALYLHTSGTTGKPKGVPLRHSNLLRGAQNVAETYSLDPSHRTYLLQVLFHIHGIVAALLAPLITGGSITIPPGGSLDASRAWSDFSQHDCNWVTGTPSILQTLLAAPCPSPAPAIRFIRSCSSPLLPTVFEALRKRFECPVVEAYAMTEASHQMCSNTLNLFSSGTVGPESGATKICIWKEGAKACELGEQGEVCVSGDNVMGGYEGVDEETNKKAFWYGTDERGNEARWFRTGDRGVLSKDGNRRLTLVGRLSEIVNRGGEKISPPEVDEAMMLASNDVKEAACFAVPHEFYGQEIEAAVVLEAGSELTEAKIQHLLEDRLAGFKIPKRIHFCKDKIPKGPTGKIQRKNLARVFGTNDSQVAVQTSGKDDVYSIIDRALGLTPGKARKSPQTTLLELGADSMGLAKISAGVTKAFGANLSVATLFSFPAVEGVVKMVKERQPNGPADEAPMPHPVPFSLLSFGQEKLHEVCQAASVNVNDLEDAYPFSATQKMSLDAFVGDRVDAPLWWMFTRYSVAEGTDRARFLQALCKLQEHEASLRWTMANVPEVGWLTLQSRPNVEDRVEQLQFKTEAEADRALNDCFQAARHVNGARTARIFLVDVESELELAILESHVFTQGQARALVLDSLTKAYNNETLESYPPYSLFAAQNPQGNDPPRLLDFWMKEKTAARESEGATWQTKQKSFITPPELVDGVLSLVDAQSVPGPFNDLTVQLGMTLPFVTEAVFALSLALYYNQQDGAFAEGHIGYDRGTSMQITDPIFSACRAFTGVYLPNYLLLSVAKSSLWTYMQYFRAVTQLREQNVCVNSSSTNADHMASFTWRFKVEGDDDEETRAPITSLIRGEKDEKVTLKGKPCFVNASRKGNHSLAITIRMQQLWLDAQRKSGSTVELVHIFATSLQYFADHGDELHELSWRDLRDAVFQAK